MQIRWPAVSLLLGTVFLIWLFSKAGGQLGHGSIRLFDVLVNAAERDPVFALALIGMGLITVIGIIRMLCNRSGG